MSLKLDFNIVPICIKELAHLLQLSNLNLEIPSIFPKKPGQLCKIPEVVTAF